MKKGFRKADKVFLAEGPKLVGDLLGHFRCRFLIATAEWLSAHRHLAVEDVTEVSEEELSRSSLLKTPTSFGPSARNTLSALRFFFNSSERIYFVAEHEANKSTAVANSA